MIPEGGQLAGPEGFHFSQPDAKLIEWFLP
jgi:hypothetical protein